MTDQLRDNTHKPRMSYALTSPALTNLLLDNCPDTLAEVTSAVHSFLCGTVDGPMMIAAIGRACSRNGRTPFEAFAAACEMGERKYARGNYLRGSTVCSHADSLGRHLIAMRHNQANDPESGLSHMDHIVWNAVRMAEVVHQPGRDDRLFYGALEPTVELDTEDVDFYDDIDDIDDDWGKELIDQASAWEWAQVPE